MICDFVCNMCGKQFKSQKTLTQHNRDVHIEEDIPCSLCDKTFRMKKHLAYHKFSKHTEKESLQCDIDCIYMTSLHCVFTLSVFGCVEPLKKISGWVFLLNGLGLFRTTLCACRSFWGGAENCSLTGKLLWPAHLFRHFLRRVQGEEEEARGFWQSMKPTQPGTRQIKVEKWLPNSVGSAHLLQSQSKYFESFRCFLLYKVLESV